MTAAEVGVLSCIYAKTGGGGWCPVNPDHPFLCKAVKLGYMSRVDNALGGENVMLVWTELGYEEIAKADIGGGMSSNSSSP